jgi:hypothetical protein
VLVLLCGGVLAVIGIAAWRVGRQVAALSTMPVPQSAPPSPKEDPLVPTNSQEALRNLRSGDNMRISMAINYLAGTTTKVDPALQNDMARELERLMKSPHPERYRAAEALVAWATPEQVPGLIDGLQRGDARMYELHAKTLRRLKDPRAIPALARGLTEKDKRTHARPALVEFGPAAEPEVLKYIDHRDYYTRQAAAAVLMEIGSEKTIPKLEEIAKRVENENRPDAARIAKEIRDLAQILKSRKK